VRVRARAHLLIFFACAGVRVRIFRNFWVRVRARARPCAVGRLIFFIFVIELKKLMKVSQK
jgi:hypothetical protein